MIGHPIWGVLPPRHGLFRLADHFEQRPIGATHGSIRGRIPLRLPSGPQEVESELEAELVEQLNFSAQVYDLITQPIIRYRKDGKDRQYALDIITYLTNLGDGPVRYLIEVKREEDLVRHAAEYADRFEVARQFARAIDGQFRIMTEAEIRTPYLHNARLLRNQVGFDPHEDEIGAVWKGLGDEKRPIGAVVQNLVGQGFSEPDARDLVERTIVIRWVTCDLSQRLSDTALIWKPLPDDGQKHRADPIMDKLFGARSG